MPVSPRTSPPPPSNTPCHGKKKKKHKLTSTSAWEVCPHTEPHLAGADLWPVFFPHDLPNLYHSLPNWAWGSCDGTLDSADCKRIGFNDASDKFYKPGDYPNNGTSKLHNVGGTLSVPPRGTVLTWSQSSTTWTVTATGYDKKAVASQSEYRATATDPDSFPTQTAENAAAGVKPIGIAVFLGAIGVLMAL